MTSNTAGIGPITKLLPVSGTFALPLIGLASLLSFGVVRARIEHNTFQGDKTVGDSQKIKQSDGKEYDPIFMATRIHGNAMENIPVTLLLAALAEINGADRTKLTTVLTTFSVLRVMHVVGLAKPSQLGRAAGYFGTLGTQLGLAVWVAWITRDYWGY